MKIPYLTDLGRPRASSETGADHLILSIVTAWLLIVGIAVFCTTIHGIVNHYSPIPFSDQWDGYLGFVHQLRLGHRSAWWEQHNEHRLVLARILFWIDAYIFGGRNIFLLIAGMSIQFFTLLLFVKQAQKGRTPVPRLAIVGIALSFLFSWIQQENFVWGFQSQFLMVYLFALCAFATFGLGIADTRPRWHGTYGASALAVLATLSMGNGIFVFAILCFQSLIMRRPWRELAVLLVSGGIVATIYFHGFQRLDQGFPSVEPHTALRLIPHFFLVFMGSAAFAAERDITVGTIFGLLSLAAMTYLAVSLYVQRAITPYRGFLIAGYALVVMSAIAATLGRYPMGIGQATVSRYDTPMLISLTCLILLGLDTIKNIKWRGIALLGAAILATWIASFQRIASIDTPELFQRNLAVLSMKIGLHRPDLTASIYPPQGWPYISQEAKYAEDVHFGPYASGWLHDAGHVRFSPSQVDNSVCRGYFDDLKHDPAGTIATGWVVTKHQRTDPVLILLVDNKDQTVGYGVSGMPRPDVKHALRTSVNAGWTSFALADTEPVAAYAYTNATFCKMTRNPD
ncbi:hypothetical protein [Caballeronia sordidicola]|uniref:hypothetical protein n=1 Tax=Caballeronia sordidicola TaxID=196367 RepID=UPI0004D0352F|nr:hypothetical protein [Caballeronia sordidicola]